MLQEAVASEEARGTTTLFRRDPAGVKERACAAYLTIVTGVRIQAS